jgi:hypothetical protein
MALVPGQHRDRPTTTQEIAPMVLAVTSTSSTIRIASCLSGIVRLQPEKFSAGSARNAAPKRSGGIASGT